jgi:hypothetical protein
VIQRAIGVKARPSLSARFVGIMNIHLVCKYPLAKNMLVGCIVMKIVLSARLDHRCLCMLLLVVTGRHVCLDRME